MSENELIQLISLLDCSCHKNNEAVKEPDEISISQTKISGTTCYGDGGIIVEVPPNGKETSFNLSYPSFKLSQPNNRTETIHTAGTSLPSREELHSQATASMSRPVIVKNRSEQQIKSEVPRHIMENILDSFDQLVDARIRQYSSILSNHCLMLSKQSDTNIITTAAKVVEYKLRTLLEIGTNISFGSISTKFTPTESIPSLTRDEDTGRNLYMLPIMLTVDIHPLHFQSHGQTSRVVKNKLEIQAPGTIKGILSAEQSEEQMLTNTHHSAVEEKNDASVSPAGISTSSSLFFGRHFEKIFIEIDCEVFLREMMEEAGAVVGMVVELTNQAWLNNQPIRKSNDDASSTISDSKEWIGSSQDPSRHAKTSLSPKLGPKTVSEASFIPPGFSQLDGDSHRDAEGEVNKQSIDDDENLIPHMSAEKARHIIDYVFGEIDDEDLVIHPPPSKKARSESSPMN